MRTMISRMRAKSYGELIERWQKKNGERGSIWWKLSMTERRNYEQRLIDLEFEGPSSTSPKENMRRWRRNMKPFTAHSKRPKLRCEEIRQPYESAVQEAQLTYETKRQEYLSVVEEIREQLEKAPDEYRQRFDEILARYNEVCCRGTRPGDRSGRVAYSRHGASREPAHR